MSLIIKNANGTTQYMQTQGQGTTTSPFLSVPAPFSLEVSKGNVYKHSTVNKFGRNSAVGTTTEDLWSGGGTYVAPTQARIHEVYSSSATDDTASTGAKTVRVYGLTSWTTTEVYEDVVMDGTTKVSTSNSYVFIHRMKVIDYGSSGPNVGLIKADAVTDLTTSAQIEVGRGQTEMAIYAIPSGESFYITQYYMSTEKSAASLSVEVEFLVNPIPNTEEVPFIIKHTNGLTTEGTNYSSHDFNPPFKVTGPAIIKMSVISSAVNTYVNGGFDGYKVLD